MAWFLGAPRSKDHSGSPVESMLVDGETSLLKKLGTLRVKFVAVGFHGHALRSTQSVAAAGQNIHFHALGVQFQERDRVYSLLCSDLIQRDDVEFLLHHRPRRGNA